MNENEKIQIAGRRGGKSITKSEEVLDEIPIPSGWERLRSEIAGLVFRGSKGTGNEGLLVILSADTIDGREWLHLSLSRRKRLPSYEEIARVRRLFFGEDEPAYQVFARASEHVNTHEFCLHLWKPIGFDPFPDTLGERAVYVGKLPW